MLLFLRLAFVLILAGLAPMASAADTRVSERDILASEAFLKYHPDLRYRLQGLREYDRGDYERARGRFLIAARWADKPSQAMLAQMHFLGRGITQDPVAAYIWMDLAAERGSPRMLVERERYWTRLDETQRAQVMERGPAVYAEYGDEAAGPRLDRMLRRGLRGMTGARLGVVGMLEVVLPTPSGNVTVSGEEFYQDAYWDRASYWSWQESHWDEVPTWRIEAVPDR